MKALIVYYSLDGNTSVLAKAIAEEIDADIVRLRPITDLTANSFIKYFKGWYQVITKYEPELETLDKTPTQYDIIFIGTPVWWGNYVPAINSFLSNYNLKKKKIALFCTSAGNSGKTLPNLTRSLSKNEILGKENFISVLKDEKSSTKHAITWAKEILSTIYFEN